MSANFYFEPVKPGRSLEVSAPSSFRGALEEAFGELPLVLSGNDAATLRGMKAAKCEPEAITQLMEAIDKYGSVRVWAVY